MSFRVRPDAPPDTVLTTAEVHALDCIEAARGAPWLGRRTLADYLPQIAMFNGYLARGCDPLPDNMVVWSDFAHLHGIGVD